MFSFISAQSTGHESCFISEHFGDTYAETKEETTPDTSSPATLSIYSLNEDEF